MKSRLLLILITAFCLCSCNRLHNDGLSSSIESYSSEPDSESEYPPYYEEHLRNKMYSINKIKMLNSIDYSFVFVTDLHWEFNTKNSPFLVRNVCSRTHIDKIVLGGDYSSYDRDNVEESKKVIDDCTNAFSFGNYAAILGNHDSNCNSSSGTQVIPSNVAYSIANNFESEYPYSAELNYEKKFCSLYLYSGTGNGSFDDDNQKMFVLDTVSKLDSTWSVLVFVHIVFSGFDNDNGISVLEPAGKKIFDFFESVKDSSECSFVGIFSGHSHLDYLNENDYSLPVTTTTCDAIGYYNQTANYYLREENTFTEQAFDVVQVDTNQRKVYLTRIGAGSDRFYFYS